MEEENKDKKENIEKQKEEAIPQKPVEASPNIQVPAAEAKKPKKRNYLLWFTILLVILAIAWLLYWFLYLQYHEYTDDAYANGNIININSAINGSVIGLFADDTDKVNEGQLLVRLDDTEYRVVFENELATLASVVLQVRQLYDNVEVNRAVVENKKSHQEKQNSILKIGIN